MSQTDPVLELEQPIYRENRRLKVVGVVIVAVGLLALFYVMEQAESTSWGPDARLSRVVPLALLFLGATNVLALGTFVLIGGFNSLPLLSNARARNGLLLKMAGANLLIVLSGLVFLDDQGAFGTSWEESYLILPVIVSFGLLARTGVLLLRRGWKHDAIPAEVLLERDPRRPVVYLRSFSTDDKILSSTGIFRWVQSVFTYMIAISVEQEIAMILGRVGPVVAIGKPGEPVPELGAARLYAGDHEWREVITDLIQRARLVVIRAGPTENLQWEIEQALKLLPRRQVVFVSWARGRDAKLTDEDLERRFGRPALMESRPVRPLLQFLARVLRLDRATFGKIIYFDQDARPRAEPIRFTMSVSDYVMLGTRPYRDPLQWAFRRVFAQLDLPWIGRKSKAVAALLALFVGAFGAHHFYMGNRRRGLYHAAFFWTMVPFFMGWIDAVRLALASEEDFKRRLTW
jgi:hypothetical protein